MYIEHDLPRKDRNTMSNFRTLANVIGSDRMFVRGNKLLVRENQTESSDNVNGEWQQVRYTRTRRQHQDNYRCNDKPRHTDNHVNNRRPYFNRNHEDNRSRKYDGGDRPTYRQDRQHGDYASARQTRDGYGHYDNQRTRSSGNSYRRHRD